MNKKWVIKKKRVYLILLGIFMALVNTAFSTNIVYADTQNENDVIVDVEVTGANNGQVTAGSEIEISYKLSNLKNIYAASIALTYDNSLIKVNSIEPGERITGNIYEAYNETAKNGNIARYAFTFLGSNEQGISGKAEFVKIKATAIKDGQLDVKNGDGKAKFELIQKVNNDMKKINSYYVNSQGETVKVEIEENKPQLNGGSNAGNDGSASTPNSSGNEDQKITVLGTGDSAKVVSGSEEDNNGEVKGNSGDNTSEDAINEEKESADTKGSDLENSTSENNTENEKTSEESKDNGANTGNNTIIVVGIVVVVAIIIAVGMYIKKRKNS